MRGEKQKMGNAGVLLTILIFMFSFNGLVALYAISETGIKSDISEMPKMESQPNILDYLTFPFKWAYYVIKLVGFTITELPAWLSFIVVSIDIVLAYIIFALIRGGS